MVKAPRKRVLKRSRSKSTTSVQPPARGREAELEAALAASERRVELLKRELLEEQARHWADLAKFEKADLRLPEQKRSGVRYDRYVWRDVYYLITDGSPGATGYMVPAKGYVQKVAKYLAEAVAEGRPAHPFEAPGAWERRALPRPTPFHEDDAKNRRAAIDYVASQTGQKPRAAWQMLKDVRTKNLPTRPRDKGPGR